MTDGKVTARPIAGMKGTSSTDQYVLRRGTRNGFDDKGDGGLRKFIFFEFGTQIT